MRERLERDWYNPRLTLLTAALLPASWLFRITSALRRTLYRGGLLARTPPGIPVIVVGNVTLGGTGKTPLVIWLVQALRERGWHPGIISRGYGGADATVREVAPDADPAQAGDEPVLLARSGAPVWIGADRNAAARGLLAAHPQTDVLVSDDGLQHYALARAIEIVVIDGARGFGNGALLPAGPLREPVARINAADAVVVNGGEPVARLFAGTPPPIFAMRLTGERLVNLAEPSRSIGAAALRGKRVHALAGIGNPARFFVALRALGLDPVCHPFPDHHRYSADELRLTEADAIVMTDKDAIKCHRIADARMWRLPVAAEVEPGLIELILEKLHGRQAA